jgi:hypothetical protein
VALFRTKKPVIADMPCVLSATGMVEVPESTGPARVKTRSVPRRGSGTGVTQGQVLSMKKA